MEYTIIKGGGLTDEYPYYIHDGKCAVGKVSNFQDANLFAQAPRLYEACKGVINWWRREYDSFYPDELDEMSKAIAKVEGKND